MSNGSTPLSLNEYQERAMTTCMPSSENFSYMMLNLVGEVGEFASKIGKSIRKGKVFIGNGRDSDLHCTLDFFSNEEECDAFDSELRKEAGDILWQLSGLCSVLGWKLEDVALMNLEKLATRKENGTIDGNGDGVTKEERNK